RFDSAARMPAADRPFGGACLPWRPLFICCGPWGGGGRGREEGGVSGEETGFPRQGQQADRTQTSGR
ncbi:hypothetical protein JOQ06_024015, partial [Pogonophryne albipinna]